MTTRTMQIPLVVLFIAAILPACSQKKPAPFAAEDLSVRDDREAPFNPPERYPAWAFDQPEYQKPAAAPMPEPAARGTDPAHFFTNKRVVMVQQPEGYTPEETPRVAIYYTDDNGFNWKRAGFFGREQSYFALETDKDGDYGVRFVGPGQSPAEHTPADPARMYHVDTGLPEMEISVEPEKAWYEVGDDIRIAWAARDPHLEQYPVRLGMLMDFSAANNDLIELQRDLADEGSIEYRISSETAGHEIVFRAEALDRAGNLGLAYSHALQVQERDDQQIVQKPVRHHDDTLAATRKTANSSTARSSTNTRMTRLEPVEKRSSSSDAPTTITGKTRVKVVTMNSESANDGNSGVAEASPNAMTDGKAETPRTESKPTRAASIGTPTRSANRHSAPMKNENNVSMKTVSIPAAANSNAAAGVDEEFVQMLDCEEREKFDATVSPDDSENDAEPIAAIDKNSPVRTVSVEEAWAPLKRAIDKLSAMTESATNGATEPAPNVNAEPAMVKSQSASTPVTAAAQSMPVVPAPVNRSTRRAQKTPMPTAVSSGNRPRDLTHGTTLVVPMPGTVESAGTAKGGTAHPWRTLGRARSSGGDSTWSLPEQKATVRTAAMESPTTTPVFAGVPKEDESADDGSEN